MPHNIDPHSETAAALNAGLESLTAAKDTLEIIPGRMVFESAIAILGLVRVRVLRSVPFIVLISRQHNQDEMIDDVAFVELAKYCVRACHVLKAVTERRGVDGLSGPVKGAIESLGKYVDPASPLCRS